jgi:hypothetical protein
VTFVQQAAKGLPTEQDNLVVVGAGGVWTAGQVPGNAVAGGTNSNKQKLNGKGAFTAEPTDILAVQRGFLIETYDLGSVDTGIVLSGGNMAVTAVGVPAGTTLTGMATFCTTGVALTHAWYALYDQTLALVRQSADTPAQFSASNVFQSLNFTAQLVTTVDALYYCAFLPVGASPTVMHKGIGVAAASGPFGANAYRAANQTGLATLPNPLVPATSSSVKWFGLY